MISAKPDLTLGTLITCELWNWRSLTSLATWEKVSEIVSEATDTLNSWCIVQLQERQENLVVYFNKYLSKNADLMFFVKR